MGPLTALLLLAAPAFAAPPLPVPGTPESMREKAMFHGVELTPEQAAGYGAVFILIDSEEEGRLCSGVRIGRNVVATAAHCLRDRGAKPTKVFFFKPSRAVELEGRLFEKHPGFRYDKDHNDVAVVSFTGEAPEGYAIMPLLDDPRALAEGTRLTIVGGGLTEKGRVPASFLKTVLKLTGGPSKDLNEFIATSDPPDTSGPCPGDSGGPLILEDQLGRSLAGLFKGYDPGSGPRLGPCIGRFFHSTAVPPHAAWIKEAAARLQADVELAKSPLP